LITQKIHLPSPALRPYVAHYNFMSSDSPEAEIKLPPLIFSGFAFLFEGNLNITSSNGKKHANLQDWISPVTINPVQLSWPGKGSIISIQFWPGKFYDFFGWPQHLFFDDTVILEDTELEKEFFRLFEQLYEAPSLELKTKLIDLFLLSHFPQKILFRPAIAYAVEEILRTRGQLSLEQLIAKTRYSERHFRRLFKESVGMNPYIFLRIVRFYHAFTIMQTGRFHSLTDIAYMAGYFDQSHFIRDFKKFWDLSPGEVLDSVNSPATELLKNTPGMKQMRETQSPIPA
jgi:AraC-like DNA-binding protein